MQITFDPTNSDECAAVADIIESMNASEPAAKAPAAKKTTAKRAAAKPDPEPVEDDGPTLEDAVARAQELVGLKLTQGVKDAVKEIGAPRVSELKGDQIAEFLEAVKDLDADVV